MGRSFPAQTDKQRHHRAQTSKAMKKVAERLRCPHCNRGFALKVERLAGVTIKTCRWCKYAREINVVTMEVTHHVPS